MDIQKLVDTLGKISKDTRSDYHLTLGKAIETLSKFKPEAKVRFDWNQSFPDNPHSYRGYYSDLALKMGDIPCMVKEFKLMLEESLGKTFEGYKGGDFKMSDSTPLWCAQYGDCGRAIMGLFQVDENNAVILTKEIE